MGLLFPLCACGFFGRVLLEEGSEGIIAESRKRALPELKNDERISAQSSFIAAMILYLYLIYLNGTR